jgi:hypothetical protein
VDRLRPKSSGIELIAFTDFKKVNGAARCENPNFQAVSLTGSYERNDGVTIVTATATLVARAL